MDRIDLLERARDLSLSGDYREALRHVDVLLQQNPRDIEALRLKGNILELQVLDKEANQRTKHVYSEKFGRARACYEQILLLEPDNIGALVDLGTHWKNLGEHERAISCYQRVIDLLSSKELTTRYQDDLGEALEGKAFALREEGSIALADEADEALRVFMRERNLPE